MIKVFIVGATGFIGADLLKSASSKFEVYGTSSSNKGELFCFKLEAPEICPFEAEIKEGDVVVMMAAISAPDICANDYQRAYAVNVIGTISFINKVINRGARVIFFSSDTVYGQQDELFDEGSNLNPSGEYAAMKAKVEKVFLGSPFFKSIRLSYVFSRGDKFTQYLFGCLNQEQEAEIFHPFYRAVIHKEDVIDAALALVERWNEFPQSVINFGGPEIISRVELKEIFNVQFIGKLKSRVIEPPTSFFVNRPRIIAMKSPMLKSLLGRPVRNITEAMQIEFIKNT